MQAMWYGDKRDRVKWGALIYLARTQKISKIVQVAFYRQQPKPELQMDAASIPIPGEVWDHFSSLRNIEMLGESIGIEIIVLDQVFDPAKRQVYIGEIIQNLDRHKPGPKLVFLDPDTGIEPGTAKAEHVSREDIRQIWAKLEPHDWLAVYQHASRKKGWLKASQHRFEQACKVKAATVFQGPELAGDVAIFAAQKTRV